MYLLRKTSEVIQRFKIVYPQYWLDMLMTKIIEANGGSDDGLNVTGTVLAILRHPKLEHEVTIPGLGQLNKILYLFGASSLQKVVIPGNNVISSSGDRYFYEKWRGATGGLGLATLGLTTPGLNIVTNDGDQYYAQAAMGESVTDDFTAAAAGLRLGSANTAPTKTDTDVTTFLSGTDHVIDATYPQTNDGDSDNTGAAVDTATWTYSYLTSEGNTTGIQEGAVSDVRAGPSTAVLSHFLFAASFDKTSSDTLKVILNGNFLGV